MNLIPIKFQIILLTFSRVHRRFPFLFLIQLFSHSHSLTHSFWFLLLHRSSPIYSISSKKIQAPFITGHHHISTTITFLLTTLISQRSITTSSPFHSSSSRTFVFLSIHFAIKEEKSSLGKHLQFLSKLLLLSKLFIFH